MTSKLTVCETPGGFIIRCTGKLACSHCGEPVISHDIDLEEFRDTHGNRMINAVRIACSGCNVVLLEVSIA